MKYNFPGHLNGLDDNEVLTSQKQYGYNSINTTHKNIWVEMVLDILKEPLPLLTIAVLLFEGYK